MQTPQISNLSNPDEIVEDLNTLSAFLAKRDINALSKDDISKITGNNKFDLAVLLGNSLTYSIEVFGKAVQNEIAEYYIIAGGKGHSTNFLKESVKNDTEFHNNLNSYHSEAEIMFKILERNYNPESNRIFLEKQSTNCGDNAQKVKNLLNEKELFPRNILLIQDPTMQLRTHASFKKVWNTDSEVSFYSHAPFIPKVKYDGKRIVFRETNIPGLWPMNRYISLIMSEVPRLRDDKSGYGPKGKDYISSVQIPGNIEKAYQQLLKHFENVVRPV